MGRSTLMNPHDGVICWGEQIGEAADGGET